MLSEQPIGVLSGENGKGLKPAFALAFAGFGFALAIGVLGFALSGGGHESSFFGEMVFAPVPFGFFMWPVVGFLIPWSNSKSIKCFIFLLLAINYCGVVSASFRDDGYCMAKTVAAVPLMVVLIVSCYLSVQVFVFHRVLRPKQ